MAHHKLSDREIEVQGSKLVAKLVNNRRDPETKWRKVRAVLGNPGPKPIHFTFLHRLGHMVIYGAEATLREIERRVEGFSNSKDLESAVYQTWRSFGKKLEALFPEIYSDYWVPIASNSVANWDAWDDDDEETESAETESAETESADVDA